MAVTPLSRKQISSRAAPIFTLLTCNSHPYLQGQTKTFMILWHIMLKNALLPNGISVLKYQNGIAGCLLKVIQSLFVNPIHARY